MKLKHMAPNGDIKHHLADIPVPLYVCLTEDQMKNIIRQLGLPKGLDDLSLVVMNKARTHITSSTHEADKYLELFINHIAGLMNRYKPKVDSTWDVESHFFQPIDFKVGGLVLNLKPQSLVLNNVLYFGTYFFPKFR